MSSWIVEDVEQWSGHEAEMTVVEGLSDLKAALRATGARIVGAYEVERVPESAFNHDGDEYLVENVIWALRAENLSVAAWDMIFGTDDVR